MEKYSKVLMACVGSSPAVITETLYALISERNWIPDKIKIITTVHGREQIEQQLFESGVWCVCAHLLGVSQDIFTSNDISVITSLDGNELEDIVSVSDHEAAGNHVAAFARNVIRSAGEVHASLAGGRKTMSFYMGFAMSLFARKSDKMSHVLVDSSEIPRKFYMPQPIESLLPAQKLCRDEWVSKNSTDYDSIRVSLADVPVIGINTDKAKVPTDIDNIYSMAVLSQKIVSGEVLPVLDIKNSKLKFTNSNVSIELGIRSLLFAVCCGEMAVNCDKMLAVADEKLKLMQIARALSTIYQVKGLGFYGLPNSWADTVLFAENIEGDAGAEKLLDPRTIDSFCQAVSGCSNKLDNSIIEAGFDLENFRTQWKKDMQKLLLPEASHYLDVVKKDNKIQFKVCIRRL